MGREKCEYCKKKIDKGNETFRDIKDPAFVGMKKKAFCCDEHADSYEEGSKNAEKCTSGCCG